MRRVAETSLLAPHRCFECVSDLGIVGIIVDVVDLVRVGLEVIQLPLGRVVEEAGERKSETVVVVVDEYRSVR